MDIKHYLAETEKHYRLRLKTIVPLDDEMMDKIEMAVAKYQPLSVGKPLKTILHRQPLDFPNVDSAEVYLVDMTFGMPAAPHVLRADIRAALNAPENFVFVRNRNEPGEIETEIINAVADIEAEAKEKGLVLLAALDDQDYNDAESTANQDSYGTAYNTALVGYLATIEKNRNDAVQRVQTAPFQWLDLPDRTDQEPVQDTANYNSNIKDAPFVSPPKEVKTPNVDYSIFGNLDPSAHEVRKVYRDAKGNKVVLSRKLSDGVK